MNYILKFTRQPGRQSYKRTSCCSVQITTKEGTRQECRNVGSMNCNFRNQSSIKPCQKIIMFSIKMQNNEILTLSISMISSFKCKSIQKEIPNASCSGVAFAQNAREQNYLMDYNWMYTYFIKAHDGLISSRLKNYN